MTKHPTNNWNFHDEAEDAFVKWFNDFYSLYTFCSEWFYGNHTEWTWTVEWFAGDCSVEDPKTREDLMRKWIYASFYEGFMRGKYAKLEEQTGLTNND